MNRHHQIFTLCIFVITTCQIAQGMFLNYLQLSEANNRNNQVPPGYHLETLNDIQLNYDPNTYSIVSGSHALSMYTYGAAGVRGGTDNKKTRVKRTYFSSLFDDTPPPASDSAFTNPPTVTGAGDVNQKTVDTSKTDEVKTLTETSTAGGNTVTTKMDSSATKVSSNGQAQTGNPSATNAVAPDGEFSTVVNDFQSFSKAAAEDLGQNMDKTLVEITPYLPLVYKVAQFVVPGLMPLDTIMFTWEVAKITASAVEKYDNGESLSKVTVEGASQVAYKYFMTKRSFSVTNEATPDSSSRITDFATNFYQKLKNMLNFRKESDSFSVPSQMNNDLSSDTNKYIDTKSKISSVSDTKFYPNTDKLKSIRELKITNPIVDDDSVQDLSDGEGHGVPNVIDIGKLKSLNLKKSSDELEKYKDSTFDADSFENLSDGEGILVDDVKNISKLKSKLSGEIDSKINIDGSINSIENLFSNSDEKVVPNIKQNEVSWKKMFSIDNTRFDELLKKSMEYQPKFIQNSDGEKLAKSLNTMKSQIPKSTENEIKNSFTNLTNKMNFGENVTENQISDLVNLLSKSTCYFIANAIRDKKTAGAN